MCQRNQLWSAQVRELNRSKLFCRRLAKNEIRSKTPGLRFDTLPGTGRMRIKRANMYQSSSFFWRQGRQVCNSKVFHGTVLQGGDGNIDKRGKGRQWSQQYLTPGLAPTINGSKYIRRDDLSTYSLYIWVWNPPATHHINLKALFFFWSKSASTKHRQFVKSRRRWRPK